MGGGRGAMGPPLGCGVCWSSKVKRFVERQNCPSRTKQHAAVLGVPKRQGRGFPCQPEGGGGKTIAVTFLGGRGRRGGLY